MLTLMYLPKALSGGLVSAATTSFVPNKEMSSRVARVPRLAPVAVNVTIVVTVVVVTVEIMADNQTLFG